MKGSHLIHKFGRKIKTSSPFILTILGSGGVIATSVMAVKATPKAIEVIKSDSRVNHDGDPYAYTKKEAFVSAWRCYIPATAIGITTIGCIIGANILNQKQQANMASLYALLDQSYKQYVKATGEVFGDDADRKVRAQVAKDMFIFGDNGVSDAQIYNPSLDDNSERVLFYDYYSQRYFESTFAAVTNAQYHFNRNWVLKGEVCINELYGFLGIDTIKGGDDIGWSYDYAEEGFAWIDFDVFRASIDDGLECLILSPVHDPTPLNWSMDEAQEIYHNGK